MAIDWDKVDFAMPFEGFDVRFKLDDGTLYCKRSLLEIHSPYFAIMFNGSYKESSSQDVPLPGKTVSGVMAVFDALRPAYSPQKGEQTKSQLFEMIELAHEFQMNGLIKHCVSTVTKMSGLSEKELLEAYKIGLLGEIKDLTDAMLPRLKDAKLTLEDFASAMSSLPEVSKNEAWTTCYETLRIEFNQLLAFAKHIPPAVFEKLVAKNAMICSFGQLKTLRPLVSIESYANLLELRLAATNNVKIRFEIENAKERLSGDGAYSSKVTTGDGSEWYLLAMERWKCLKVRVFCSNKHRLTCSVEIDVRLVSQKSQVPDRQRQFLSTFADGEIYGVCEVIKWADLCNPGAGFIKNGRIIVEADITMIE